MGVLLDSERYYDVLSQSRPKAYIWFSLEIESMGQSWETLWSWTSWNFGHKQCCFQAHMINSYSELEGLSLHLEENHRAVPAVSRRQSGVWRSLVGGEMLPIKTAEVDHEQTHPYSYVGLSLENKNIWKVEILTLCRSLINQWDVMCSYLNFQTSEVIPHNYKSAVHILVRLR